MRFTTIQNLLLILSLSAFSACVTAEQVVSNAGYETSNDGFFQAASDGQIDVIHAFLDLNFSPNSQIEHGFTPLMATAWNGHQEAAMILLDNGADVNMKDDRSNTALHFATYLNSTDVVNVLLKNGADPNIRGHRGSTPLVSAVIQDHYEAASLLIQACANPFLENHSGESALSISQERNLNEVRWLLKTAWVYKGVTLP